MARKWQREYESIDGLSDSVVTVDPPGGYWPALVSFEFNYGAGTLMVEDARAIALLLTQGANEAERLMTEARAASPEGK